VKFSETQGYTQKKREKCTEIGFVLSCRWLAIQWSPGPGPNTVYTKVSMATTAVP